MCGILVGILLGVVGGRLLDGTPTETETAYAKGEDGPTRDFQTRADLDALQKALAADIEARTALTVEVGRLQEQLARLVAGSEPGAVAESDRALSGGRPSDESEAEPGAGAESTEAEERPAFDTEALVVAGVHRVDAGRLRERWEEFEMDKLELAHSSVREGWLFSPRHRRELRTLQQAMREDLGDESYDLLLFAMGQPNRVVVREVLERSPAREIGLEPGDTILSYDGTRVFRAGELRHATALGEPGAFVRIELVREGRPLELYVPRGPLGLILKSESRLPPGD